MEDTKILNRLKRAVFIAGCAAAFAAALLVMRIDSAHLTAYNSDSAIPLLMVNKSDLEWFDAYYWGQDRFGSLPFLLARAATAAGLFWTPEALQLYLLGWVAAGCALYSQLFSDLKRTACALFAAGALLVPFFRVHLFEIAQFFPWQMPVLFAAMLCLRRLNSHASASRGVMAAAVCFLAVWASPLNILFLIPFALIETTASEGKDLRARLRRSFAALSVVAAGISAEYALRALYHRKVFALYGNEYRTMSWINRQEIVPALQEVANRLAETPLLALADACGAAALIVLTIRLWKERSLPASLRAALALGAAGLVQLPVLVSVHHFVVSGYPDRFFFLTHAGLFSAAAICIFWFLKHRLRIDFALTAFLMILLLFVPGRQDRPEFQQWRALSRDVCSREPLLLGSYWHTYLLASLSRGCSPLPENGVNRMPWLVLRPGKTAIVVEEARTPETIPGSLRAYLNGRIRQTGIWKITGDLRTAEFVVLSN